MLLVLSFIVSLILVISSAYLFYKWKWNIIIVSALIIIVSLILWSNKIDIPYLVILIILGGAGGLTYKSGKSLKFFILVSSFSIATIFSGNYYYLKNYQNIDILNASRSEAIRLLNVYKIPEEKKVELINDLDRWISIANDIIPFSSFLYSLILSILGYYVVRVFLSRFLNAVSIKGLEFFRLNDYLIFFLITGWTIFLLISKSKLYTVYLIGFNTALIVSLLYMIQAIGVVKFLLLKNGLPTFILPLVLITMFILGINALIFASILLIGFGTLDLWADFRKLNVNNSKQE